MFTEKRTERRRKKKQEGSYTFWDFVFDLLFYIPELIFLPFRLVFYLFRFLAKSIFDVF
ncbi:hypothetical protein LC048_11685 [Mesobacillus subterraneus]|uniref:hypothetical protein n=1 Tax=Mesobacillus subterraneus TaxID=285983 RepID=UPI001CFE2610|nr:hypothetical protein [Mesobacillus subterraneus]WLR57450.1 hypothetical protein LC048_11685 [Mesobacillus subterraneus]